ncbi:MAG: ABC transporter ATP-binding protein [Armatimonadetes bacterium]|nr:ABC transporter ATP-binding protein [Armatimonadota bacterium]
MLEVVNLRKAYGPLLAVDDVSFSLSPGDVFGFIGPNGAGKTTTIRMLTTLLEPTGGTARINGADIWKDPMGVRRQIGYMPDFFGLYDDIKVWEYLDFFAAIYKIPTRDRNAVIDNVLELTDLTTKRESFVQTLSRGMQQRLCLAKCLVHDPALLLLDEPASGLDPRARAEFKELVVELGRMGKIVIVSSHILPELAAFCNKVGIIERGKMLAYGAVNDIVKQVRAGRHIDVRLLGEGDGAVDVISKMPHVIKVSTVGPSALEIEFSGDDQQQAALLATMLAKGIRILDFHERKFDLEDVFLQITTGAVN